MPCLVQEGMYHSGEILNRIICDDHTKNISFILREGKKWEMENVAAKSPQYVLARLLLPR